MEERKVACGGINLKRVQADMVSGLRLLSEAFACARDVEADLWEFAVEVEELRYAGLRNTHLRWLARKGYIEHGPETGTPAHGECGLEINRLGFSDRSCVILTESGAGFASEVLQEWSDDSRGEPARFGSNGSTGPQQRVLPPGQFHSPSESAQKPRPYWDRDRKELRVGNTLVKQFKVPSLNQETLLMAFEEEGWPARIDDPLPPCPDISPKMRLHNTIKSLNRNQKHALIRFTGDGTGEGVLWDLMEP
jgi:hypothetical protein